MKHIFTRNCAEIPVLNKMKRLPKTVIDEALKLQTAWYSPSEQLQSMYGWIR